VIVATGPVLVTTASKTDVLCNGGVTGTITVNQPAAGTPPYSYSLNRITWQGSPVFSGLAAGTYTVYFRESNGCENSLSITVSEPGVLSATVSTVAAICNGESNGVINVTPAGGIQPYEYSINAGVSWQNSNIFNMAAGNYSVTIRDVNGCTARQLITVAEPALLTATSTNSNATCNGGNDGTITVVANGGNSNYMYSLDGTNFQSSNKFNVAPGNYTITVKDNLGCSKSFDTNVLLTNNLIYTAQADPVICESLSTQLQLNSNATVYTWTPATGLSNTSINNPVANPIVTTEYYVTATLGRCSIIDTVVVKVNKAPVPNAGSDGFICYGQTFQLNATGGTQYKWSPSTFLDNPDIQNPISTPTNNMTYLLSVISDINGCASLITDDISIDVTQPIKVKTFPYDTIGYTGDQFQIKAVPSDSDAINFSWTPVRGLNFSNIANPFVTIGAIGDDVLYQVIVATVAGCKGEGYVRVRVFRGPDIYVPNAFTPNGDGRNDKFYPVPVGIKSLNYFRVFNRWGQLVFSTNQLNEGWDGTLSGLKQGNGTFVWMAEAITKENKIITKKGTVTLIR
jgi:gliding motility-associated-like protein